MNPFVKNDLPVSVICPKSPKNYQTIEQNSKRQNRLRSINIGFSLAVVPDARSLCCKLSDHRGIFELLNCVTFFQLNPKLTASYPQICLREYDNAILCLLIYLLICSLLQCLSIASIWIKQPLLDHVVFEPWNTVFQAIRHSFSDMVG